MDGETKIILLVGSLMFLMTAISALRWAFIAGSIVFWGIVAYSTILSKAEKELYSEEGEESGSSGLACGGCTLKI